MIGIPETQTGTRVDLLDTLELGGIRFEQSKKRTAAKAQINAQEMVVAERQVEDEHRGTRSF